MKRSESRENVFKMLFQMESQKDFSETAEKSYLERFVEDKSDLAYIENVYYAFAENKTAVDARIEGASKGWHISRIAEVDLAILRLAVTEIAFLNDSDIPVNVSVSEAVNLAKKYGSDESSAFVNGILGTIAKEK